MEEAIALPPEIGGNDPAKGHVRIYAALIDLMIGVVALLILGRVKSAIPGMVGWICFWTLAGLLVLCRDAVDGKSPGKLCLGLSVYTPKGRRGGLLNSFTRNAIFALPVVGLLLGVPRAFAQLLAGKGRRMGEGASIVKSDR